MFWNSLLLKWECFFSCYEIEYSEETKSFKDYFQWMDEEKFTKDKILKDLEESILEVIIGALHHTMIAMLGSQYIISPHEPNEFLEEDWFSEYNSDSLGLYDSNEVHSQPTIFSHNPLFSQFDYQDPIGTWLEKSFMERYLLHSILHILTYVNGVMDDLILSIFYECVIQL